MIRSVKINIGMGALIDGASFEDSEVYDADFEDLVLFPASTDPDSLSEEEFIDQRRIVKIDEIEAQLRDEIESGEPIRVAGISDVNYGPTIRLPAVDEATVTLDVSPLFTGQKVYEGADDVESGRHNLLRYGGTYETGR